MPKTTQRGGSFLLNEAGSTRVMCPESFTDDQRQFYRTAIQFSREKVLAASDRIEQKEEGLLRHLLREAGELGLCMIDIPEAYGGLGLDKTTSLLVAEAKTLQASWSVTFGGHVGIGTLPIVWYGNEEQKRHYLPKLATAEWVAAYALTETGSGSDALGAKTKAVLTPDGKHYVLNGSKQFITNAAFADVFVVFAKVDGDKFTGFIVERNTPGLSIGPEEHKMGIRGSSTCPLIFEDAKVPAGNVLGEIGKGHKIAFNILNLGRLKLGLGVIGGMKHHLALALEYAHDRKQFNTAIAKFPLIREKFARMASAIYAVESVAYRTSGLIDDQLVGEDKSASDFEQKTVAAIEEFAIEASILKVFGTEALAFVLDEALQIHGGYGFIEEYPIEQAYRDQRVNRIFEGTNEINRMLITGMLLKRAMKGELPLLDAVHAVEQELSQKSLPKRASKDALDAEALAAEYLKRMALYSLKAAVETFETELEKHQDVMAAVSDIVMDAFAVDSMVARSRQVAEGGKVDPVRVALTRLFTTEAQTRSLERARKVLCASLKDAELTSALERALQLSFFTPYDPAAVREEILARVEQVSGYPFPYV